MEQKIKLTQKKINEIVKVINDDLTSNTINIMYKVDLKNNSNVKFYKGHELDSMYLLEIFNDKLFFINIDIDLIRKIIDILKPNELILPKQTTLEI